MLKPKITLVILVSVIIQSTFKSQNIFKKSSYISYFSGTEIEGKNVDKLFRKSTKTKTNLRAFQRQK